jgi:glycosyltransferase involved in cell wall biosynthesis
MSASDEPYEIIIVDDNSPDNSDEMVARLAEDGHPIRIITRVNERDLSSAVIRGFREARGNFLVCMDADLSHPPEAIPQLLKCSVNICEIPIHFADRKCGKSKLNLKEQLNYVRHLKRLAGFKYGNFFYFILNEHCNKNR